MTRPQQQRRIDRILDDSYLERLTERDMREVRAMRDDCRDEEGRLSYARRLAQGRIDVVAVEQARRAGERDDELMEALPSILAGPRTSPEEHSPLHTSVAPVHAYPEIGGRGDEHLLVDASLARLPDLDDDELAELLERLNAEEQRLSSIRRVVHARLDALQAELVRRYKQGDLELDEVIASTIEDRD